ncbi:MAG: hypothetical protein IT373_20280 [Polyangiaceae bacterium]|nr:hypothetical protein [Polyangiaceae bacterium]
MTEATAEGSVCTPNIGPRERGKRMGFGLAFGAVTCGVAAGVLLGGAPAWGRALVFLPALMSGYGVFQAREKT